MNHSLRHRLGSGRSTAFGWRAASVALLLALAGSLPGPGAVHRAARAAGPAPAPPGKSIFDEDWKPPPDSRPPPREAPEPAPPPEPEPEAPRLRPGPPPEPADPSVALPVPPASALAAAEKRVRETFAAEYARDAAADRATLARGLLQEAAQSLGDPPLLYVLLREARDLAAAAGDVETTLDAARGLRAAFAMQPAQGKELERSALASAARAVASAPAEAVTPAAARRATEMILGAAEYELSAGDYAAAGQIAAHAEAPARRSNQPDLVARTRTRVAALQAIAAEFEAVKPSLGTLTSRGDPAACLAAGKFYTFTLDQTLRGLPLLAKGSDPALKSLAGRDLAAATAPAKQQAALADAWSQAAKAQPPTGSARDWMQRRALKWYDVALVTLEGATRAPTEKRANDLRLSRLRRGGLLGEYFVGPAFNHRRFTRVDPRLEFDWKAGPPDDGIPADFFTARWTGWLKAPSAGDYKLVAVHDDGVRVWVDGVLAWEKWVGGSHRTGEAVNLTGGFQEVKVEYSQYWGGSHLALGWRPAAAEIALTKAIPPDALYHDPPPPGPVFDAPAEPGADGAVTLHAAAARMYGGPRLHRLNDSDPGYVANWVRLSAWVGWDLHVPGGAYDVEIEVSCDPTNAGSKYAVSVEPYRLESTVPDSGAWGQFVTRKLGRVRLAEGRQSLRIRPISRSHKVLMDVRRVTLTPVKAR